MFPSLEALFAEWYAQRVVCPTWFLTQTMKMDESELFAIVVSLETHHSNRPEFAHATLPSAADGLTNSANEFQAKFDLPKTRDHSHLLLFIIAGIVNFSGESGPDCRALNFSGIANVLVFQIATELAPNFCQYFLALH